MNRQTHFRRRDSRSPLVWLQDFIRDTYKHRLFRDRNRIMLAGGDVAGSKILHEDTFSLRSNQNREEVPYRPASPRSMHQANAWMIDSGEIACGDFAAAIRPALQSWKKCPMQNRGMEFFHAAIVADDFLFVLTALSVVPQCLDRGERFRRVSQV